jgi:hypothetical protein
MCAVCFSAVQLIPAAGVAARLVWVRMTPERDALAVPLAQSSGTSEEDVTLSVVSGE